MFDEKEILALNPEVVSDVKSVVQKGAFKIAHRQFFYQEQF
jgi:hypothetical protein